jgi:putative transcriptional regulator
MAIVRKNLDELRTERRTIDRAKIAATTDDDIRRQAIEDGEDPDADASLEELELVIPVHVVRRKLGMSQAQFAKAFHIPVGTIRNWEQNRVKPDPAARALLTILYRQPEAALKAFQAA